MTQEATRISLASTSTLLDMCSFMNGPDEMGHKAAKSRKLTIRDCIDTCNSYINKEPRCKLNCHSVIDRGRQQTCDTIRDDVRILLFDAVYSLTYQLRLLPKILRVTTNQEYELEPARKAL